MPFIILKSAKNVSGFLYYSYYLQQNNRMYSFFSVCHDDQRSVKKNKISKNTITTITIIENKKTKYSIQCTIFVIFLFLFNSALCEILRITV